MTERDRNPVEGDEPDRLLDDEAELDPPALTADIAEEVELRRSLALDLEEFEGGIEG